MYPLIKLLNHALSSMNPRLRHNQLHSVVLENIERAQSRRQMPQGGSSAFLPESKIIGTTIK